MMNESKCMKRISFREYLMTQFIHIVLRVYFPQNRVLSDNNYVRLFNT